MTGKKELGKTVVSERDTGRRSGELLGNAKGKRLPHGEGEEKGDRLSLRSELVWDKFWVLEGEKRSWC